VETVGESWRGPALGLLPDRVYAELQVPVEPGDVWIAYTDGFPEAANARDEMFGASRVREQLARATGVVQESGGRIVQEVLSFLGDQPQSDDMCLIGWGRLLAKEDTAMPTDELSAVHGNVTTMMRPG
jgi:serine phosphatase RsbU (regulator of sigma subunit)